MLLAQQPAAEIDRILQHTATTDPQSLLIFLLLHHQQQLRMNKYMYVVLKALPLDRAFDRALNTSLARSSTPSIHAGRRGEDL